MWDLIVFQPNHASLIKYHIFNHQKHRKMLLINTNNMHKIGFLFIIFFKCFNPCTSCRPMRTRACQKNQKTSQHQPWVLQYPCCLPNPCWNPSIVSQTPSGCLRWFELNGEETRQFAQNPSQQDPLKSLQVYLFKHRWILETLKITI